MTTQPVTRMMTTGECYQYANKQGWSAEKCYAEADRHASADRFNNADKWGAVALQLDLEASEGSHNE